MIASTQKTLAEKTLLVLVPAAVEPSPRTDVADALRGRCFIADLLAERGHIAEPLDITPDLLQSPERTIKLLNSTGAHCVFNLFEGFGNDSDAEYTFRELVEEAGIPCTGNPSRVLRTCLSKEESSRKLRRAGIPVPKGITLYPGFDRSAMEGLRPPFFMKPLMEDASIGVDGSSLIFSIKELLPKALEKLARFPKGVRVEEFLPGKECSVACIGNDPYTVVGASVIDYEEYPDSPRFLDYDSKWNPDSPLYSLLPKRAEGVLRDQAAKLATEAGRTLGCRGYFRVDMREREGTLYVIDVNPNPDIAPGSGFLRQCRENGLSEVDAVHSLLGLAFEEQSRREIQ